MKINRNPIRLNKFIDEQKEVLEAINTLKVFPCLRSAIFRRKTKRLDTNGWWNFSDPVYDVSETNLIRECHRLQGPERGKESLPRRFAGRFSISLSSFSLRAHRLRNFTQFSIIGTNKTATTKMDNSKKNTDLNTPANVQSPIVDKAEIVADFAALATDDAASTIAVALDQPQAGPSRQRTPSPQEPAQGPANAEAQPQPAPRFNFNAFQVVEYIVSDSDDDDDDVNPFDRDPEEIGMLFPNRRVLSSQRRMKGI